MRSADFDRTLAEAVLAMAREPTLASTLARVVALAQESITSCDAALVLVVGGGSGSRCVASTDSTLAEILDEHVSASGASVDRALRSGQAVHTRDLGSDEQWPEPTRELHATLGFQSLYAVPLGVDDAPLGALALYSKTLDAYDTEDLETARLVGVHATAALTGAVYRDQMTTAMQSRTVIGQATGMIMEQFGLDPTQAFGVLRRLSQTRNEKLRDVAQRVVETGRI